MQLSIYIIYNKDLRYNEIYTHGNIQDNPDHRDMDNGSNNELHANLYLVMLY